MRKTLFATAMITTLLASSVPMTPYAADGNIVKKGEGYIVISGQGCSSLKQILETICSNLGNGNIICPEIPDKPETPELPDVQEPVTPELPDTQKPVTPEQPDTQTPVTPEPPNTQKPVTPESPDVQEPVTPELPDTQKPIIPEQPDIQEPDNGSSDETIHTYASRILDLVNAERAKAGLSALRLDTGITAAANVRAKEIKQSFSHTRPNGSSFSTALQEQGVTYRGSGENIAWGQKSPEQVMNAWMNSSGHRANILNPNFQNIGIGYYQDANGRNYWVQLFTY